MNLRIALLLFALGAPSSALQGQPPAAVTPPPSSSTATTPFLAKPKPSESLESSFVALKVALDGLTIDKWKGSAGVRTEANANVASIRRDIDSTLPPLLAATDAAPDSATKLLPAYRNVEALYDVVLRVAITARIAAPVPQSAGLDQALLQLEQGRRAIGDRLQAASDAEEKQVGSLQVALKAAAAPPPATPAAVADCPAPAPAPKKKARPAAKPTPPATPPTN
jgi:hypothetical protein